MMATTAASGTPTSRWWPPRLPARLPNLAGKWLTLYTIIWAIALPLSLFGASRGTYMLLTTPAMWTPYGIATSDDTSGLHVDSVMSAAAHAAKLRAGDYVIAVDGWSVPRTAARSAARSHVMKPDGAVTTFTIRRPNGDIYKAQLVRSLAFEEERFRQAGVSRTFARAINLVGILLLPALFISAAILLFVRRRREAVPALLSLSFLMFGTIVNGGEMLRISIDTLNVIGTVGTVCLYAALFAFPSGRFEPRWTALPFLLLIPAVLVDAVLGDVSQLSGPVSIGFSLACLAALISRYRKVRPGPERLQLRWAFLGLAAGVFLWMLSGVGSAAVLAWQAEDPRWVSWQYVFVQTLGTWGLGVMALGLIVSILRFRLYDADAVIGRSAAYGALTIGFVALFAGSQKIIELLGQVYLGQNIGGFAGGIGAALAAVAISPMHARAHRWAEHRFQRALFNLRNCLPTLVGDLRETAGVKQVAAATLDSVVAGVQARAAALTVGDNVIDARGIPAGEVDQWRASSTPSSGGGIDYDPADPLFPVRVPLEADGHGCVGWLLLARRPDGSLFGKAERDALNEIAEPVARALQVSLRRDEREASYRQSFAAIERRLAAIETVHARPRPRGRT